MPPAASEVQSTRPIPLLSCGDPSLSLSFWGMLGVTGRAQDSMKACQALLSTLQQGPHYR